MSRRIDKVNELIKQEVSKTIEKEVSSEVGFLTVTSVDVTPDLRLADIWISIYNKKIEKPEEVFEKLTPVIQKILNKRLHLKYVPKITLKIDRSSAYAFEIENTLDKLKKQ